MECKNKSSAPALVSFTPDKLPGGYAPRRHSVSMTPSLQGNDRKRVSQKDR